MDNFKISFVVMAVFAISLKSASSHERYRANTGNFLDVEDIPVTEKDIRDPSQPYMYLQPYDVLSGKYDDKPDDGFICSRNCDKYSDPRICYYQFVAEQYSVMGVACEDCPRNITACQNYGCIPADGVERTILTLSRQLCAPSIQVCKNDRIIIDLINHLPGRDITLHFHGLHQSETPWMDGVPMVTQCAVLPYTIFRYDFVADIPGTMFFHSHEAFQMLDGISGPLIVREKLIDDPLTPVLYDLLDGLPIYDKHSHVIFIQDWMHSITDERIPGYARNSAMYGLTLNSFLINGKGSVLVNGTDTGTPLATFTVRKGFAYRFRIIASLNLDCRAVLTFQSHSVKVIAVDGSPVMPEDVGSMSFSSGERVDVLLIANQEVSSYWIRVESRNKECSTAYQLAVLKYEGSSLDKPTTNPDLGYKYPILNDVTEGCKTDGSSTALCIGSLKSVLPVPPAIFTKNPHARIFLTATLYLLDPNILYSEGVYFSEYYVPIGGDDLYTDTYNNITNQFPSKPILIHEIPEGDETCTVRKCSSVDLCTCLHLLKVPKDAVVEIVLQTDSPSDNADIAHSHHKHGGYWYVMYQGPNDPSIRDGTYIDNLKNYFPPQKDTSTVPIGGATVVRFIADNPGMWLIHCHMLIHHHNGMSAVIQVGERHDFKKAPVDFPTCGNYMPPI